MSLEWINQNSGVLSVTFSLFAVIVAIVIPLSIAKIQKKIALYEERLKVFIELDFIRGFCEALEKFEGYKQYKSDAVKIKGYLFSVWVICLRTKYPDAWDIRFESNPSKGEFLFIGDQKNMERICEMHLSDQFSNLRRSKFVLEEKIEQDVKEISELYYSIMTDINKRIFYGWDDDELIDIDNLLHQNRAFQNSKSIKKISKMLKL